MAVALTYVGFSLVALALLTFVYVVEDIKGKRVFLLSLRAKLDTLLSVLVTKFEQVAFSFTNGFMRLLLHYGAHSVLKRVLAVIRKLEMKVEELVRHNRKVAKDISAVKVRNHLDAIAEHKQEVALSETKKDEMRAH